ncbi:MAG: LolA family protein [Bacteroidota bacterium]
MKKILFLFVCCVTVNVHAQSPEELVRSIKSKLDRVVNYSATGKMKTNVLFLKAPIAKVQVYFKKPNQLRILNEKGISFIPKGSMNMDLCQLFIDPAGFDLLDLGPDKKSGWRVIKLLPRDPNSEVVLSTIYVDAAAGLIRRSSTTTRENGTFELEMTYGSYAEYGLADKVIFSFNSQEYKLPKGITFDYDDGSVKKPATTGKPTKGRVEIQYTNYQINKGVPESVFR